MKTKFLLGILLIAILLSVTASAATADLISVSTPADLTKSNFEATFDITKTNATDDIVFTIVPTNIDVKDDLGKKIVVSFDSLSGTILATEPKKTIKATITPESGFDFSDLDFGKYELSTATINARNITDASINETETVKLYFVNGFCKYGAFGDLDITEIEDKTVDNEDEWSWQPLNNVEFQVEVENNREDDERIVIEYKIRNSEGKVVNFDGDDTEQSVSIDSGDSEKVIFSLNVPADMENGYYQLFIKAYVKGHEDDKVDGGCIDNFDGDFFQKISVTRDERRAVVVDENKLVLPDFLVCGELATVSAKIYNIGEEDEDKVLVNLYSEELNLDLYNVISDLANGESAVASFNFDVPETVKAGSYGFSLITYYEYDEDDGKAEDIKAYASNSDYDLDKDYSFNLKLNCIEEPEKAVLITADADQEYEATAGKEVTIGINVKNTGKETSEFEIKIQDFESWAEESKIAPRTITLDSEQTQEVSISLDVNKDAEEGWQTFTVAVLSDDGVVAEKEIEIYVGASESSGITGSVIADNLRKNWFIWVIVIINIILIIAIILVARRIATAR